MAGGTLPCHAIAAGSVAGAATVHLDSLAESDPEESDEASVIRITTNLTGRSTHQLRSRED